MAGRLRAFVCLALWGLALCATAPTCLAGEPGPIRLGLTAGFTGPTQAMAVELYRGAQAAFARQNRDGGIGGRRIELLAADDYYEPDPAIVNTVRFLDQGVLALFSALGTPTVSRELPVLRGRAGEHARLFFPVTGLEAARQPPYVRYVYNLRASYFQEIEALIEAFFRRGLTRVAICHQADAFGRSAWDGAGRALARRGRELCAEATFSRSAAAVDDMTPQARILAASRPEAVLLIGAAPACAAVIRDMRRRGLQMPVGVVSFAGGEILLRALAALGGPLGLPLDDGLIFSQVTPSWRDPDLPAARDYRRDLAALAPADAAPPPGGWSGELPEGSATGFEGYLNARLLLKVLAGMPDPADRRQLDAAALAAGPADIGLDQPLYLDGRHHQALHTIYLFTAANGVLVPLEAVAATAGD